MRYLANELAQQEIYDVTLCFDSLTGDFMCPDSVTYKSWTEVASDFETHGAQFYLAIVRMGFATDGWSYLIRNRLSDIRRMASHVIQYDQGPVGNSLVGRIKNLSLESYMIRKRHPRIRVSPAVEKGFTDSAWINQRNGGFLFPGPGDDDIDRALISAKYIPNLHILTTVSKSHQRRKGLTKLIRAVDSVPNDLQLRIIRSTPDFTGRGHLSDSDLSEEREFQTLLSNSRQDIRLFENLSQEETLQVMAGSTLFILISSAESFSISNIEALGLGIPSILSSTNGSKNNMPKGTFLEVPEKIGSDHLGLIVSDILDNKAGNELLQAGEDIRQLAKSRNKKAGLSHLLSRFD